MALGKKKQHRLIREVREVPVIPGAIMEAWCPRCRAYVALFSYLYVVEDDSDGPLCIGKAYSCTTPGCAL